SLANVQFVRGHAAGDSTTKVQLCVKTPLGQNARESSVKIRPATKAHLLRVALYLLLAVYAIPFALAQRKAAERSEARASPASGGVTSQDFEPALDNYHSFAADDFLVPTGQSGFGVGCLTWGRKTTYLATQ